MPPPSPPTTGPYCGPRPLTTKNLVFYVNTAQSYLEIHQGDHMVACFPITPGSTAIPTPKGEWHVVEKTLLPEFRWDKSVLMTGKRSDTAYQLPPGPNNPVGITWIALNKPGIGMHGTATPGHHRALGQPRVHPPVQLGCLQGLRHGRAGHEGHHRIEAKSAGPISARKLPQMVVLSVRWFR